MILRRTTALMGAAGCLALTACTTVSAPPPLPLNAPGVTRIEMPEVLGTPVAVVPPELPGGTLSPGQTATFDIAFRIDARGNVVDSSLLASSHPDLAPAVLATHRKWIYAVATRQDPCRITRFAGTQRIAVTLKDGKPIAALDPATVIERLGAQTAPQVVRDAGLTVPNYRSVISSLPYPREALRQGVEARLALLVDFGADGSVVDAFPVNAAYDRWGFAESAIKVARRLKAEPPPGRAMRACIPIDFRLR